MASPGHEASRVSLEASNQQERSRHGPGQRVRSLLNFFGPHLRVRHQKVVTLLYSIALTGAVGWALNFLVNVMPFMSSRAHGFCKNHDEQLLVNTMMTFTYFLWCVVVRILACVPRVYLRFLQVRVSTHGICRASGIHMVFFGPLYFFSLASVLFLVQVHYHPECKEKNPEMYRHLKLFPLYSIVLGTYCSLIFLWHHRLLREALEFRETDDRRAPPKTLENLRTVVFDEAIFGNEEGKSYPAECAICLGPWELDEVIKVTPCNHAFHMECLGGWLRTNRTCAMCRHDVTKEPSREKYPGPRQGALALELAPGPRAGTTERAAPSVGAAQTIATETALRNQEEAAPVVTATADGLSDEAPPLVEVSVDAGSDDAKDSVPVQAVWATHPHAMTS